MFLEIHILQNYALSNLNRDDTGAPKSCIFGGTRRARISSQCLKRAVRTYFREESLVPSELLSFRTRWIQGELAKRLEQDGIEREKANQVAAIALQLLNFKLKNGKTEYLLMLGEREISQMAMLCHEHLESLLSADDQVKREKDKRKDKAEAANLLLQAINGGDALDIALFGRMIANHANKNVDAAVQMAHAFSTHTVATEFDFYSAVEELKQENNDEGAGAGMLGTILYNSSCYYRYANLDLVQLASNLKQNRGYIESATRAFIEGMIHAVPTGKKTNSAPQNPPAFIMIVLRDKGLWSLANAFVKPVFAGPKGDLIQLSAQRLLGYWEQLANLYGTEEIGYAGMASYLFSEKVKEVPAPAITMEVSVPVLLDRVMQEIQTERI